MVGANEVPPILRKKLVIHPVHGQGNMATAIDISKNLSLMANQKTLDGFPMTTEPELLRRSLRKLVRPANHFALTRLLHAVSSISQIGQKGKIPMGAADQDIPLVHQDRKPIKGEPFARAIDTESGFGLINSPMGEADEVPLILGKKLIANEIQRSRHMTAAIDISVVLPLVVDQKTIDPILLADHPKLLHGTRSHFLHLSYDPSSQPAFPPHSSPISEEQNPTDDHAQ